MANFAVILPAAGKSRRFHDKHYKKTFIPLDNRPVWLYAAETFVNRADVKQVIVVIDPDDEEYFRQKFGANVAIMGFEVALGGKERVDSVRNGLEQVRDEIDYVAVHDAARPCIADSWIDAVFSAAERSGAAILAHRVTATLKRADEAGDRVVETVQRQNLFEAQTPQVFRKDLLIDAYAKRGDFQATDDAQLVERAGHPVTLVEGSPMNLKITTKADLKLASYILKGLPKPKLPGLDHPFADDNLWR